MAGIKSGINGQINNNIVTDGLVFYVDPAYKKSYPGSGTTSTDLVNSVTGTLQSSGMFENTNNGVFDFDGATNYIDFGNADELNITEFITISAWVKASSSSTDRCYVAKRGTSGNAYQISQYSNKAIGLSIWIGSSRKDLLGTTNHVQDVWYHVVGTYNGSYMRVYVNGVEENNQAQIGSIDTTTNTFRIAAENFSSAYWFNGKISSVQIYNRALLAGDVFQNYQAQKERFGL